MSALHVGDEVVGGQEVLGNAGVLLIYGVSSIDLLYRNWVKTVFYKDLINFTDGAIINIERLSPLFVEDVAVFIVPGVCNGGLEEDIRKDLGDILADSCPLLLFVHFDQEEDFVHQVYPVEEHVPENCYEIGAPLFTR